MHGVLGGIRPEWFTAEEMSMVSKIDGVMTLGKGPERDLDVDAQIKMLPKEVQDLLVFLSHKQRRAYLVGKQAEQVELLHEAKNKRIETTRC